MLIVEILQLKLDIPTYQLLLSMLIIFVSGYIYGKGSK